MTRAEHLAWAKKRAIAYVDRGQCAVAVTSLLSDLGKHKAWETDDQRQFLAAMLSLAVSQIVVGDVQGIRAWVEGFN